MKWTKKEIIVKCKNSFNYNLMYIKGNKEKKYTSKLSI